MAWLDNTLEETKRFQLTEDLNSLETGEEFEDGNIKTVVRGLRDVIKYFKPEDVDLSEEELEEIIDDLKNSPRIVETWTYEEYLNEPLFKQDNIPQGYFEAIGEYGAEHVIKETVELWDEILEDGYVYKDLKPENIRFHNGKGVVVDYLDGRAIEKLENTEDITSAAANTFDLFVIELLEEIEHRYNVEADSGMIQATITEHSDYFEQMTPMKDPLLYFQNAFRSEKF